jgi:hypothetical protein
MNATPPLYRNASGSTSVVGLGPVKSLQSNAPIVKRETLVYAHPAQPIDQIEPMTPDQCILATSEIDLDDDDQILMECAVIHTNVVGRLDRHNSTLRKVFVNPPLLYLGTADCYGIADLGDELVLVRDDENRYGTL